MAASEGATFDLGAIPEVERVAFYGALFAMADADGTLQPEELALIYAALDTDGMSDPAREKVRGYIVQPPRFAECLRTLATGAPETRYGAMVQLVDLALADGRVEPSERASLDLARGLLDISDAQLAAIRVFVREVRAVRERGKDDAKAAEAMRKAARGLEEAGVPTAAAVFSGSVAALGAAGLSGALTALGLGIVPGIGVAVLLGTAAWFTVRRLVSGTGARRGGKTRGGALGDAIALLDRSIADLNRQGVRASRVDALRARREALVALRDRRESVAR